MTRPQRDRGLARAGLPQHATDEVDERLGRQGGQLGGGHAASWAEISEMTSMASVATDRWSTAGTGVNDDGVTVVPLGCGELRGRPVPGWGTGRVRRGADCRTVPEGEASREGDAAALGAGRGEEVAVGQLGRDDRGC